MSKKPDMASGSNGPAAEGTDAAHYVLGVLSAGDRLEFEHALATDPDLQAEVALWQDHLLGMAHAVEPVEPTAELYEAIAAAIDAKPQPGSTTVRADDGDWLELFDGVFKKPLFVDEHEGAESYLLRITSGASCPAHSHTKVEECLVIEGEMIIGEARFRAGDYHAVPPNIPHLPITSETGALLFIRAELAA